jgi:hypothetical protein
MSYVTNTVLAFGLGDGPDFGAHAVDAINDGFPEAGGGFRIVPDDAVGGTKALECNLATGAFNYVPVDDLISYLRRFSWEAFGIPWAQLMVCDQNDDGFGIAELYREPGSDVAAWYEVPTP